MQNSYIHNSFIFVGNTSHTGEYSATIHFNPILTAVAAESQKMPLQNVCSEGIVGLSNGDEYIGSIGPYDDDGY
jgi:hypothetical protein